jgi:uncharacterized membrane protein YraQ (UPF0718 family)
LARLFLVVVVAGGALLAPSASIISGVARAWAYAWSIVLEAAPYILVGAIAASCFERLARRSAFAALFAAIAPGCDCGMNGFARSLRSLPAPFASCVILWGSCCNPIALFATYQILGSRLTLARIAGALMAALIAGVLQRAFRANWTVDAACDSHATALGPIAHLENGLKLLLPAALISSTVLAFFPDLMRLHASPLLAAIAGAVLSPCSTADPILARTFSASTAAQAAFVVAAQCLDVRQLGLLRRCFGSPGVGIALVAGALGCVVAAMVAR